MGMSQEEVAETLGIRVGAVKSRLFRARETLKVELKRLLGE
jgi:DNA-directed RNA polymerase specialized sigma24 family protein